MRRPPHVGRVVHHVGAGQQLDLGVGQGGGVVGTACRQKLDQREQEVTVQEGGQGGREVARGAGRQGGGRGGRHKGSGVGRRGREERRPAVDLCVQNG